MSTKIEVNAMGDACPLPVVKTLKALKQLDGEGAVVTSVDNETAVKNISKMAQEKGCTASVEKVSDAEWHVTVATSGAVAVADPEQDGAAFCDASAGEGKLVISVYTDCMGRGDDELGHKLMKAFIFAVTQQEELPATMLFYNGGAKLTVEGSPVLDDLKGLSHSSELGLEALTAERLSIWYEYGQWPTEAQGASLAADWLSRTKRSLPLAQRRHLSDLSDQLARQIAGSLSREAGLI